MKNIKVISAENAELEILECTSCGFHIGIDVSYLDQVGSVCMPCPSCSASLEVDGFEDLTQ